MLYTYWTPLQKLLRDDPQTTASREEDGKGRALPGKNCAPPLAKSWLRVWTQHSNAWLSAMSYLVALHSKLIIDELSDPLFPMTGLGSSEL